MRPVAIKQWRAEIGPLSRLPENDQPSSRIRVAAAGGFTEAARKRKECEHTGRAGVVLDVKSSGVL